MSLFKGERVCVFSGFEGRLTFHGQPASGARIVRHVNWKDKKGETDESVADENGNFIFESRWGKLKQMLPAQFTANQSLTVYYEEQEYLIWTSVKLSKHEYSEFGGKPADLRCELSEDIRRVEAKDLTSEVVGTNCYWELENH